MTTFEAPRTIYKLEFEDEVCAGLMVRVRALSLAEVLAGRDLLNAQWATDTELNAAQVHEKLAELHQLFIDHLVEWNLAENGEPVPPTLEGLRSQEGAFIGQIIGAWRSNTVGVSAPLAQPSSDGDPSVEQSIPMETLSESLAS